MRNTLRIILQLPPRTVFCVLALTCAAYLLIDFIPIQNIGFLRDFETRIVTSLWQALVWSLYSFFICFYLFYELGLSRNLISSSFTQFMQKNFLEYLTTQIRVLISTSLWILVFIIPGLIMMLRYSIAQAFVFFHPQFYTDRTIDPLKLSLQKVGLKKIGFMAFLALLVFIFPLVIDSTFEHAHFMFEPTGRFFQIFFYSFLNILTYGYIFNTYLDVTEEIYV